MQAWGSGSMVHMHSMEALLQKRRGAAQQLVPPSRGALRLRGTDGPPALREPHVESSHPSSAQGASTSNSHPRQSASADLAAGAVPVSQVRCACVTAPDTRPRGVVLVHTLAYQRSTRPAHRGVLVVCTSCVACSVGRGCPLTDGHARSSLCFCRRRRLQPCHARTWHRRTPGWRRRRRRRRRRRLRAVEGCTATRRRCGRRLRRPASRRAIRHCWTYACRTPGR